MTSSTPPQPTASKPNIDEQLARWENEPGGLMPLLHDIQHALGYIPPECVGDIAATMNLSRAEVHGVITYYPHFRSQPAGRHVVQVCQAEACRSMGAQALMAHAQGTLGCKAHGHSADGAFTLEPVYCLGMCASSPALMVGDRVHARITPEKFDRLVDRLRSAA